MATGFPVKANYATGDVLTAANMNDLAGTLNYLDPTAKGDLFPASDGSTLTRLGIGTNGQVLTADSTQTTGMKWASASGGDLIKIASSTISAAGSVSFNNVFTSSYNNYKIFIQLQKTTSGNAAVTLRKRAGGTDETGAGYYYSGTKTTWSNTTAVAYGAAATSFSLGQVANTYLYVASLDIMYPATSPYGFGIAGMIMSGDENNQSTIMGTQIGNATADGFSIILASGAMNGVVKVYGYNN